ncbi:unnamed protein product [Amoebophrya sp. A120]|nr:unnamed protein product [Amoebophrya sp. A120]|eukprot:GSA120T00000521001.1
MMEPPRPPSRSRIRLNRLDTAPEVSFYRTFHNHFSEQKENAAESSSSGGHQGRDKQDRVSSRNNMQYPSLMNQTMSGKRFVLRPLVSGNGPGLADHGFYLPGGTTATGMPMSDPHNQLSSSSSCRELPSFQRPVSRGEQRPVSRGRGGISTNDQDGLNNTTCGQGGPPGSNSSCSPTMFHPAGGNNTNTVGGIINGSSSAGSCGITTGVAGLDHHGGPATSIPSSSGTTSGIGGPSGPSSSTSNGLSRCSSTRQLGVSSRSGGVVPGQSGSCHVVGHQMTSCASEVTLGTSSKSSSSCGIVVGAGGDCIPRVRSLESFDERREITRDYKKHRVERPSDQIRPSSRQQNTRPNSRCGLTSSHSGLILPSISTTRSKSSKDSHIFLD